MYKCTCNVPLSVLEHNASPIAATKQCKDGHLLSSYLESSLAAKRNGLLSVGGQ